MQSNRGFENQSRSFTIHIIAMFFGYPLVAVLADITNLNELAIVFRSAVLISSIFFIIKYFQNSKKVMPKNTVFFIFFLLVTLLWLFFRAQLYIINGDVGSSVKLRLYTWGFWAEFFIPLLSVIYIYRCELEYNFFKRILFIIFLITISYSLIVGYNYMSVQLIYGYRVGLPRLNPISLAQYIVSFYIFLSTVVFIRNGLMGKLIMAAICFALILPTGTKQAYLIMSILFLFLLVMENRHDTFKIFFLLLIGPLFFVLFKGNSLDGFGDYTQQFIERIFFDDGSSNSTQGRIQAYYNAIEVFSNNPLTGGSLVDPKLQIYPHNFILEVLMVAGIFPLILLSMFLFAVFSRILKFNSLTNEEKLFSLIFIQYFIGGLISSSIYSSLSFLASGMAILVFQAKQNQNQNQTANSKDKLGSKYV